MSEIDEQNTPDTTDVTGEPNDTGEQGASPEETELSSSAETSVADEANEPDAANEANVPDAADEANEPDAAPTHNRRRVLIVVLVILVVIIIIVAIIVGSCVATTDNDAQQQDQQQEEPADTAQNEDADQEGALEEETDEPQAEEEPAEALEEEPAEGEEVEEVRPNVATQGESMPATTEEVAATYEDILNEYRAFAEYVAQGGSPENLAVDSVTNTWVDYPHVTAMDSASYLLDEIPSHFEYAYTDLDYDGIPELLIGRSVWIPIINNFGVNLLQMFSYQDGQAVELFQSYSGNRNQHVVGVPDYFDITSNGYIRSQGGDDPTKTVFTAYELIDGRLYEREQLTADAETNTYWLLTADGEQEEVDSAALLDFETRYPWASIDYESVADDSPLGDWQDLS